MYSRILSSILSSTKPLLILYLSSTKTLLIFYIPSTAEACFYVAISVPYCAIRVPYSAIRLPYCRQAPSYRRVTYSQRGNTLFPTWEHFIPNVGISRSQHGNITLSYSITGCLFTQGRIVVLKTSRGFVEV